MSIANNEGYLRFLPAFLARKDDGDSNAEPLLASFLAGFEEMLTGRADAPTALVLGGQTTPAPPAIQTKIAALDALFDPYRTTAVRWLSTWVGLDPQQFRSERIQRRATQCIVPLYGIRGTVTAIRAMVELYISELPALSVIVDGGNSLHSVYVNDDVESELTSQSVVPLARIAPVHAPVAMTTSAGKYLWILEAIGETLTPSSGVAKSLARVARFDTNTALFDLIVDVARPAADSWSAPCALAVTDSGDLLILDETGLFKCTPPVASRQVVSQLLIGTPSLLPASALVLSGMHALVLEKASGSSPHGSIASIDLSTPTALTRISLPAAIRAARSLYVSIDGTLFIADGGTDQSPGGCVWQLSSDGTTASLVGSAAGPDSPLVMPIALTELAGDLFVLDAGMAPWGDLGPKTRSPTLARGSTILRRTGTSAGDAWNPTTARAAFAAPVALAALGDRVWVADHGLQMQSADLSAGVTAAHWRTDANQIVAQIFFTSGGPNTVPEPTQVAALHDLRVLMAQEKPAHVLATIDRLQ